MTFSNPEPEQIRQLLLDVRSVAMVGLSPEPSRPSFRVASGLRDLGYRVIPVRPLPQSAGFATTSDLASVVNSPSRMAGSSISNVLEVRPLHGGAKPSGAGVAASHLLPQSAGFASNVSEVRPMIDEMPGEKAYPDLESLPFLPDIVDVFRAAEHVPAIVESCIKLGIRNLWLQEGVVHEAAALRARQAGITVVMDRCMWRDAQKLGVRPV